MAFTGRPARGFLPAPGFGTPYRERRPGRRMDESQFVIAIKPYYEALPSAAARCLASKPGRAYRVKRECGLGGSSCLPCAT